MPNCFEVNVHRNKMLFAREILAVEGDVGHRVVLVLAMSFLCVEVRSGLCSQRMLRGPETAKAAGADEPFFN